MERARRWGEGRRSPCGWHQAGEVGWVGGSGTCKLSQVQNRARVWHIIWAPKIFVKLVNE